MNRCICTVLLCCGFAATGHAEKLAESPAPLEVRYTDGTREAFEATAPTYHLLGELRTPHRLLDAETGGELLSLALIGEDGKEYSTHNVAQDSRINLYRR